MNLDESRNENAFVAISKTIFKVPDSYCNQVKQFGKIDALLAMILFLLYCVDMALAGILSQYVSVSPNRTFLFFLRCGTMYLQRRILL